MNQKNLSSHLNPRSYSHPNHIHSHFYNSQAETTITQHSNPSPSLDLSKPLVVKGDGKIYPRNPTNSYVSKYTDGFFGYLGYGSDSLSFANAKMIVIKQFKVFIGRNFGLTFPRRGKP